MTRLVELADVVRSKNAKPFYLTVDLMFSDVAAYRQVVDSGVLTTALFAELYGMPETAIRVVDYPAALALKVTMERLVPGGSLTDRDVLGCQQAAPLYDVEIPDVEVELP
jgi:hypothetical protein